jgi:predicted hotdog family 3-hydroxylacyl-ACP dehydratase
LNKVSITILRLFYANSALIDVMSDKIIEFEQLQTLLPHAGSMCLLKQVADWDQQQISCLASSHLAGDNPLRDGDCLPVEAGIEYAAQAMAIHGQLCGGGESEPRIGYLAVLSNVDWHCERLDDVDDDLVIIATRLMATADGSSYEFQLCAGGATLLSGQAVVALQ